MEFLLDADHRELRERARRFARELAAPRAAEIDRSESYPWNTVAALKQEGFLGMTIPREYGGGGKSLLDAVLVIEELSRACGVTGRIVVEANLGAVQAIMKYGSHSQKSRTAELVLAGDKPAICITEPEAGSAASQMTTRADRHEDVYRVSGKKHWITGGGVSRLHLIFARVFDQKGQEQGIGGFLAVRGESPGLVVGRRERTMGLRGIPETELLFHDLEIEESMRLVPPGDPRRGFAELMKAYNTQRLGAASVALGIAVGAFELALAYTQEREQFGFPGARQAAQAKIFASEMAVRVTNDALQLFGAAGYSRDQPLERMVRDARMFTIGGGTAQVLRTLVASRLLKRKLPQTRDGQAGLPSLNR